MDAVAPVKNPSAGWSDPPIIGAQSEVQKVASQPRGCVHYKCRCFADAIRARANWTTSIAVNRTYIISYIPVQK